MAKEALCSVEPCSRCRFRYGTIGPYIACGYILVKQTRRPCPAGKGCTVFERGKSFSEASSGHVVIKKIEKKCNRCGAVFVAGTKAKHCPKCKEEFQRMQTEAYKAKKKLEREPIVRTCPSCGKTFNSLSYQKSYCQECRETYTRDQLQHRRRKWIKQQQN